MRKFALGAQMSICGGEGRKSVLQGNLMERCQMDERSSLQIMQESFQAFDSSEEIAVRTMELPELIQEAIQSNDWSACSYYIKLLWRTFLSDLQDAEVEFVLIPPLNMFFEKLKPSNTANMAKTLFYKILGEVISEFNFKEVICFVPTVGSYEGVETQTASRALGTYQGSIPITITNADYGKAVEVISANGKVGFIYLDNVWPVAGEHFNASPLPMPAVTAIEQIDESLRQDFFEGLTSFSEIKGSINQTIIFDSKEEAKNFSQLLFDRYGIIDYQSYTKGYMKDSGKEVEIIYPENNCWLFFPCCMPTRYGVTLTPGDRRLIHDAWQQGNRVTFEEVPESEEAQAAGVGGGDDNPRAPLLEAGKPPNYRSM